MSYRGIGGMLLRLAALTFVMAGLGACYYAPPPPPPPGYAYAPGYYYPGYYYGPPVYGSVFIGGHFH
ncbi:MAG TPA: hypothetical protein VEJ16_11475 [Alphaproteobacteria bacterium]|nr:hypothetical protein [Alphaproteobacteria bacterium]